MELLEPHSQDILIERHTMCCGLSFAVFSLNRPKYLNALSLEMLQCLHHYLALWQNDSSVAFVVLQSTSERSFCAGGDVRAVRQYVVQGEGEKVAEFFRTEYTVDEMLHRYVKPVVVFGQGLIMGGGAGLFVGASHRLAYEQSSFLYAGSPLLDYFPMWAHLGF